MLLVEYRQHDSETFRVWTEEDARYGSFQLLNINQLRVVIRACTLMGGLCRPARDSHEDPVDMSTFMLEQLTDHQQHREQITSI